MLNELVKLNPKLFDAGVEKKPTRAGYGTGLRAAGERDKNVVALSADLTESTQAHLFAEKFPERFFQTGVAEQNMAAVAAGLGISGKIPFISSYATFSPGRNWEQIRTTIAYNDSNVKIAGHHSGLATGPDGATHQAMEDLAIMRAMPNIKVIYPCDALEAEKATLAAALIWGPVYLRFVREKTPALTTPETPFIPGQAEVFWESKKKPQAVIIGCGPLLYEALLAARELEVQGIGTVVLNSHTLKPLDEKQIVALARVCGAVVTVEEHQVIGGLGGAVAELLSEKAPTPMEFIGMRDVFGESGSAGELLAKYGMDAKAIVKATQRVIKRKK